MQKWVEERPDPLFGGVAIAMRSWRNNKRGRSTGDTVPVHGVVARQEKRATGERVGRKGGRWLWLLGPAPWIPLEAPLCPGEQRNSQGSVDGWHRACGWLGFLAG